MKLLAKSLLEQAVNHPIVLGVCATVCFCVWIVIRADKLFADDWGAE